MEGLLGTKPIDPMTQGLLSAAFAGLAASGPSRTPVGLGQVIGQAGMQGMNQFGQAQQAQIANSLQSLQIQRAQEEMAQAKRQRDAIQAYGNSLPEVERPQFMANPSAYLQSKAKAAEPYSLRPGEQRFMGNQPVASAPEAFTLSPGQARVSGGNVVAALPERAQTESDATGIRRYITGPNVGQAVPGFDSMKAPEGFSRGPDGRLVIDPGYLAGRREIARAGATRVNTPVTIRQEGEESKTVGKFFGEQYGDIQKAGFNAATTIAKLDRLQSLLDGVATGKLTPAATEVAALGESLGIKVDKNLGAKQAARALANEIALELRNPSGGAGMPGALSDKDREFLAAMTPNLATTPEGNRLLIETRKKIARRDQEVSRLAAQYRRKKGNMDEGFYDELARFSAANPLFPSVENAASTDQAAPSRALTGQPRFLGYENAAPSRALTGQPRFMGYENAAPSRALTGQPRFMGGQ